MPPLPPFVKRDEKEPENEILETSQRACVRADRAVDPVCVDLCGGRDAGGAGACADDGQRGAPDSGGGADAGGQDGQGFRAGASGLIFFASDGLVQNRVAGYVQQGALPTFGRLLKTGAYATDNGLLTQAPPNTGAGWYSLATGAWPGVHGSTNNTFHKNGAAVQRAAPRPSTRACCRRRRWRRPPSAAARRWPRSSGRAAAARPSTDRPSTSATSSPAAAWPPTTSAPTTTRRSSPRSACSSIIPAGFAGQAPFAGAAPVDASGWTNAPAILQPGQGDAAAGAGFRRRQVRAERVHLRLDQRQQDQLRPGAVLRRARTARPRWRRWAGASGPT